MEGEEVVVGGEGGEVWGASTLQPRSRQPLPHVEQCAIFLMLLTVFYEQVAEEFEGGVVAEPGFLGLVLSSPPYQLPYPFFRERTQVHNEKRALGHVIVVEVEEGGEVLVLEVQLLLLIGITKQLLKEVRVPRKVQGEANGYHCEYRQQILRRFFLFLLEGHGSVRVFLRKFLDLFRLLIAEVAVIG